jgi:hypothetical protein
MPHNQFNASRSDLHNSDALTDQSGTAPPKEKGSLNLLAHLHMALSWQHESPQAVGNIAVTLEIHRR